MMSHSQDRIIKMERKELIPGKSAFVFEKTSCPCCGHILNAVANVGDCDDVPIAGDVSVCGKCTSYLIFDDDFSIRLMTVDEICELDNDVLYALTAARNQLQKLKQMQEQYNEWE